MGMINREKNQERIDEILKRTSELKALIEKYSQNSANKESYRNLKEQLEAERVSYQVMPDKLYLNKLENACVVIQKSLEKITQIENEILNETSSKVKALNL